MDHLDDNNDAASKAEPRASDPNGGRMPVGQRPTEPGGTGGPQAAARTGDPANPSGGAARSAAEGA
jgi:hypothetical protein